MCLAGNMEGAMQVSAEFFFYSGMQNDWGTALKHPNIFPALHVFISFFQVIKGLHCKSRASENPIRMSDSHLCIPRNETVQPRYFQNRILMFCLPIPTLWEIYMYKLSRIGIFFAAAKYSMWTDPGNIYRNALKFGHFFNFDTFFWC